MDNSDQKQVPFSRLRQMSVKRQNLEKSSDELTANLEELQKVNEEQDQRITNTITELQKQQQMAEELLQTDGADASGRRKVQREPSMIRQLRQWSTADVIRWLENTKLHKFILLFQRHHVSGADLADINLPFLEDYDHISVEDREILLSEVYELLRLQCSEDNDSSRITTSVEKEKYMAAVQLTKDKELYQRSISMPYVILSPQHSSSSHSDTLSPTPKLRKRSTEPGIDITGRSSNQVPKRSISADMSIEKNISHPISSGDALTLKQDAAPTKGTQKESECIKWHESSNLYNALVGKSQQNIYCVRLEKQNRGQFGVTMETDHLGNVVIGHVEQTSQPSDVHSGDRLLEVNGFKIIPNITDLHEYNLSNVQKIMEENKVLDLVLVRNPSIDDRDHGIGNVTPTHDVPVSEEFKWNQLRRLLVTMKNQDVDPSELIKSIPLSDLQNIKDGHVLQDEMEKLQNTITEQQEKIKSLEADMESKKTSIEELEFQRDAALNISRKLGEPNRQGETTYYKITMDTLAIQSASKEQVVELLKDIVKEASKQKFYLDRLISVVVDEVPWILEQVDAEFDDMSLGGQSEEFC